MEMRLIKNCGVCEKGPLTLLWDLPRFPLTEKFGPFDPSKELSFDQKLLFCEECGHVQLGNQLSPHLLYTPSEYSFRTSQSKTARSGTELFFSFFNKVRGNRRFSSLLDVGGNDLFLAAMTEIQRKCVIDPVCANDHGKVVDGIKIIGKFIEQVDFKNENLFPDLIFCRHVLEHVAKPKEMIQTLLRQSSPDAMCVFEIPCFENLREANRFDAVFHQHYHYFDLTTFQRLIQEVGAEYVAHEYNRQGSCGGALLIAFTPKKGSSLKSSFPNHQLRKTEILDAIQKYEAHMSVVGSQLKKFPKQIYGYGASLMLATLGYHLKTDFSDLICILDDDEHKNGYEYQNIPIKVVHSRRCLIQPDSNFLITSLENTRVIFKRITEFSPRRIFVPFIA